MLAPEKDDPALGADLQRNNDFNYKHMDPHGYAAPLGSHIRRMNPRAQNVWANDRNFHELGNEHDPIIGTQDGTLENKIPKRPIRKKITGLPAFTTVKGGAYFFLPGLKALRYLAKSGSPLP